MAKEDDDSALAKELAKAQKALKDQEKEFAALAAKLKAFEGVDIEALQSASKKLAEREEEDAKKSKDWEGLLGKAKKDLATLAETKDAEIASLRTELESYAVEGAITTAIAGKCRPALINAAVERISKGVDVVEVGGKRVAMWGASNVDDRIRQWSETDEGKDFMLAAKHSGGGSAGDQGSGSQANPDDFTRAYAFFDRTNPGFNLTQQGKLLNEKPELYERCLARAQEAGVA